MSLKIEDVKVGDALEVLRKVTVCKCAIDAGLIVTDIFSDKFITSGGFSFDVNEINLFKKKEKSQYTFDDLIDVSSKAVKDGLFELIKTDFKSLIALFDSYHFDADPVLVFHNDENNHVNCEHIKSLYKETFVIETEADIKRIKKGAKIILSNRALLTAKDEYYVAEDHILIDAYTNQCVTRQNLNSNIGIVFLKGATVEQERGRDDRS